MTQEEKNELIKEIEKDIFLNLHLHIFYNLDYNRNPIYYIGLYFKEKLICCESLEEFKLK